VGIGSDVDEPEYLQVGFYRQPVENCKHGATSTLRVNALRSPFAGNDTRWIICAWFVVCCPPVLGSTR